jgi:hypothetical protein
METGGQTPPSGVENVDAVLSALGRWPTFHDAEVSSLSLRRSTADTGADLFLDVHVRNYAPRNEGTTQFEMACTASVLIGLCFLDVEDVKIEEFNGQNVIHSLHCRNSNGGYEVEVESSYGLGGSWKCKRVQVTRIEALEPT